MYKKQDYKGVFDKVLEFASKMTNDELAIFQEMLDTNDYSMFEAISNLLDTRIIKEI